MKPFTTIAAVIFGLMALLHAYRIATHFQVIVGSHTIAQEVSWVALIVAAVLSFGLFRKLNVELEVEDVAVLHDIVLALLAQLAASRAPASPFSAI
jgi:hypothetical protein